MAGTLEDKKNVITHFFLGWQKNYNVSALATLTEAQKDYIFKYFVSRDTSQNATGDTNVFARMGDPAQYIDSKWTQENIKKAIRNTYVVNKENKVINGAPSQEMYFQIAFKLEEKGRLSLNKSSAKPTYTDGNNAYDLTGAEYTVYSDNKLTKSVGKLTVGSNGKTNTLTLPVGTYYVKETKAPKGYELNSKVETVTVKAQ